MVTGGGGTIGSELCRQIIANNPGKLLVIDIYENGAYELQMELKRFYPDADVEVLIASVRDYDRMENIFSMYRQHSSGTDAGDGIGASYSWTFRDPALCGLFRIHGT